VDGGEPRGGDALYHEPRGWEEFCAETTDEELAAAALEWITANVGFLRDEADRRQSGPEHRLWSAAEAVSLVAYRAATGGGLVNSLRKHAVGNPIKNPQALLLTYLNGAVGELRQQHRVHAGRERGLLPGDGAAGTSSTPDHDPDAEIDASYGRLIDILAGDLDRVSRSPRPKGPEDVERVLAYLDQQEEALLHIFRRYTPAEVGELAKSWDDDTRRCVLLGIFPLDLPATAVAGYRRLRGLTGNGASTNSTSKKIRRLRKSMERAWPTDQAPRRGARSRPAQGIGPRPAGGEEGSR
jgi:hypothetical protein